MAMSVFGEAGWKMGGGVLFLPSMCLDTTGKGVAEVTWPSWMVHPERDLRRVLWLRTPLGMEIMDMGLTSARVHVDGISAAASVGFFTLVDDEGRFSPACEVQVENSEGMVKCLYQPNEQGGLERVASMWESRFVYPRSSFLVITRHNGDMLVDLQVQHSYIEMFRNWTPRIVDLNVPMEWVAELGRWQDETGVIRVGEGVEAIEDDNPRGPMDDRVSRADGKGLVVALAIGEQRRVVTVADTFGVDVSMVKEALREPFVGVDTLYEQLLRYLPSGVGRFLGMQR